ncbi:helix-turn-helix domain-containing protein [Prosthecobacter sp.]|uniref:helix-turn-helix domain-containing protein n=1 Tax=Prosthecobacter sp. TaxID=1965333 RepID=UPI003784478D
MNCTSEQVCKHLGISRPTLHSYVKQHHLNPKRLLGGQLRFFQSEVDRLLT